jgi:hypothetical protein
LTYALHEVLLTQRDCEQGLGLLNDAMSNYEKALLSDPTNEPLKATLQKLREKIRSSHADGTREREIEGGDMVPQAMAPTPASFDGILDEIPSAIPTPVDPAYAVADETAAPPQLIGTLVTGFVPHAPGIY